MFLVRSARVAGVLLGMAVVPILTAQQAAPLGGERLVAALRSGGYVLVMRHATSPGTPPDATTANSDNVALERQLDGAGRAAAQAMGRALRDLRIPTGGILTSPRYRVLETVIRAGFGVPTVANELGDGTQGTQPRGEAAFAFLRRAAAERPRQDTNTILVTHQQNISGAFPEITPPVAEGEVLVCRQDGRGGTVVVARIAIDEWPRLQEP